MLEETIRQSEWWERAAKTPDRHYAEDDSISVAHHLLAVADNVRRLLIQHEPAPFVANLRDVLKAQDIDTDDALPSFIRPRCCTISPSP